MRNTELDQSAPRPVTLVVAFLALATAAVALKPSAEVPPLNVAAIGKAGPSLLAAAALRPKYPYSIVPGGVYSAAELIAAIRRDPSIRTHFSDFNAKEARLVRLTEDHYSYVSYRIHNQIFWTRHRLKLPKGEVLLTDGSKYTRCRCGNRISDKAQMNVAAMEPLALLSLPQMTFDNLRDFEFTEAPQVADNRQLLLNLDIMREFSEEDLQDQSSDARIKLKNPAPPPHSHDRWLAALPLAALSLLALNHHHSGPAVNSLTASGSGTGNTGGPGTNVPPSVPPGGGSGGNPGGGSGGNPGGGPKPPPVIPPVSPVPEPAELGAEFLAVLGLFAVKLAWTRRRGA
ncbi:MAG: hypothetical protein JO270_03915 [Acidobacteriaceae bacterium]|nr:hypothetical protein [Acidobacteriaceae bacterium]